MPTIRVNGVELYYEDTSPGSGAETIVFSHGLLWSGRMFDAQIAALKDSYRCITYDHRGQGRTPVTRAGYDMDTLTLDAAALIEALGVAPCHFAGLSMGGFVGMRLAARRPALLRSLILIETSADPEPPENIPRYRALARVARWIGLRPVASRVMPIMFGKTFLSDPARAAERAEWQRRLAANNRAGIVRALDGVIARRSIYDEIASIRLPTLVLSGEEDVATPPEQARRIAARIPGARLVSIPAAGHTSTVEQSATVNAALLGFLESLK